MLRGSSSAQRTREVQKERSSRGGGGTARRLYADDGEVFSIVFQGRFEQDYDLVDYFEDYEIGDEEVDLDDFDDDDIYELAEELNCRGYREDSKPNEIRKAIQRRVNELEPVQQVKHYLARNKGKQGKQLFLQCGDPEAAVRANSWKFETTCVPCFERMEGDKGISSQILFTWTVFDTRVQHKVPRLYVEDSEDDEDEDESDVRGRGRRRGRGRDRSKGKKKKSEYEPCTMDAKNRCKWCSHNAKIDDRAQEEIPLEQLKMLVEEEGYARNYYGGNKSLELPTTEFSKIDDLEQQARQWCRSCCEGKLSAIGATCPECEEEMDFEDLIADGWDPDLPPNERVVRCTECRERVDPEITYECSECDSPVPARLGDFRVRTKMTIEGRNNARQWSFSLEGQPRPPKVGEDEEMDRMIAQPLPNYAVAFAPPPEREQLQQLDLRENPITGETLSSAGSRGAPSIGGRRRDDDSHEEETENRGRRDKGKQVKIGKVSKARTGFFRRG